MLNWNLWVEEECMWKKWCQPFRNMARFIILVDVLETSVEGNETDKRIRTTYVEANSNQQNNHKHSDQSKHSVEIISIHLCLSLYLYSLYIYTQYTVSKIKRTQTHTNELCGSYYKSDLIYNCVISLRNISNYVIYHHTINLEIYLHFLEDPKVTLDFNTRTSKFGMISLDITVWGNIHCCPCTIG